MMRFQSRICIKVLLFCYVVSVSAVDDLISLNDFEDFPFKLNDTGVDFGADYLGINNVGCNSNITAPQDCHVGRDIDNPDNSDGHAGFNLTKIAADGTELAANALTWSCVKDNVTGLIWEVKNDDFSSIHYRYKDFKWGGIGHLGSNYGTYYDDWDVLVSTTNSETLCGKSNWRVPNNDELLTIIDLGFSGDRLDVNYFPFIGGIYWTINPWVDFSKACFVRFSTSNALLGFTDRWILNQVMLLSE